MLHCGMPHVYYTYRMNIKTYIFRYMLAKKILKCNYWNFNKIRKRGRDIGQGNHYLKSVRQV